MPKMKTHKGLLKRVKVSARGKVRYNRSNAGHLMSGKDGNRCRRMRKHSVLSNPKLASRIRRMLGVA
ncbi:MAG: 50S ribosomal protein L35 [Phycisphaerales bacterium]|nr:50S ribosomal protein L35 [Phycisphaerales bacterium]